MFATANMTTPADGAAPVMNMGLVTDTNRHTALDAGVVIHEFSHGVTSRLVGGPLNNHALDAPQSGAMGEGRATTSPARSPGPVWSAPGW